MEEEFKPIKTIEGYSISNFGNVRNDKTNKILKQFDTGTGYKGITINNKRFRVHRLVGEAFIPNPSNKPCIDHIDNNRINNNANNLRWVTYTENNCNMSLAKNNKTGVKGIYFNKIENLWEAKITHNKNNYHLGFYKTKEEAVEARLKKSEELFGEYRNKCEINLTIKTKKEVIINLKIIDDDEDEEYKKLEEEFEQKIK
jgi:hypothetical protein